MNAHSRKIEKRGWLRTAQGKDTVLGYLCLLPVMVYASIFLIFPVFYSLALSFQKWTLNGPKRYIGLENYKRIFNDEVFWLSLKNAGRYAIWFVPLSIISALLVALLLNQKIRGMKLYRTAYFVPVVSSGVAVAVVWAFLFDTHYGLINDWLGRVGIPGLGWLTDPKYAMLSVIIFSIWKSLGSNVVIYLAALQGVPQQLYEAAEIDGAGSWAKFRHITLPMVSPTTFFMLIMGLIGAFQVFEQIMIMTGGGPMRSTYVVYMYMYDYAFRYNEMGYGSAVGYIMAIIIFALTIINMKVSRRFVHYDQV